MLKMISKYIGLHSRRYSDNPEEKRFAKAWEKLNEDGNTLNWLLKEGDQKGSPSEVSKRDMVVAATVIQWLGSSVGQFWLGELGYVKQIKNDDK